MLRIYLISAFNSKIILKKIVSLLLILSFFFSISLSAKITDVNSKDLPDIFVTGNAIIFNSGESPDNDNSGFKKSDIKNNEADIFIVDGALIYNAKAFSNAKITKLKKKAISKKLNKPNRKTLATQRIAVSNKKLAVTACYTSTPNSENFSQSEKHKIVVSLSRSQSIAKTIVSEYKSLNKNLCFLIKQNFQYTNPLVKVYYFSGKHSVRPPTSMS